MKPIFVSLALVLALMAGAASADQTYVVRKGDTLYRIAKKFKVDQQKIREANDLDSADIRTGTKLTIPSKETGGRKQAVKKGAADPVRTEKANTARHEASFISAETPSPSRETIYHKVKKGDTLASVARKYSLPVKDLRELNNFSKNTKLKPGQELLVRKTGPKTYTVRKGDNISKVAKRYNISVEELQDLNELDSEDLSPGQKLVLEPWTEQDARNYPAVSAASLSEDIKILAESPELDSIGMKERLILFARKMLNIPYRFGGSTFMGIDCSGYVQKVFGFLDVSLPRTAREQFHVGEAVSKEELSIGDLVFFRTYASFPSHVGIYLGNDLFIHASSRSRKVSIDSLDTPYYVKRFIGAKRLFGDELDKRIDLREQG
jgi:peptidoglycan endopeptidase LytE